MTNLLAAIVVTLVTNVTERFPQRDGIVFQNAGDSYVLPLGELAVNPTKKWVRTEVKRITTVEFEFCGAKHAKPVKEETVSDVEVEYRMQPQWTATTTNDLAALVADTITLTNCVLCITNSLVEWKMNVGTNGIPK